jgi:hypothetical protein
MFRIGHACMGSMTIGGVLAASRVRSKAGSQQKLSMWFERAF